MIDAFVVEFDAVGTAGWIAAEVGDLIVEIVVALP